MVPAPTGAESCACPRLPTTPPRPAGERDNSDWSREARSILLITCSNISGLLLARGAARQHEIGTRLALGASRRRVVRQLLTEGLALSAAASVLSLATYALTLRLLPALEDSFGTQLSLDLRLDHRALLFAMCLGLVTTMLFGLAPALITSRTGVSGALKDQGLTSSGSGRTRLRRFLVVTQLALTVVLLIAAGLLTRMILHYMSMDPGFDKNVLFFSQSETRYETDMEAKIGFYRRSLEQIRNVAGVRSAAWAEQLPFDRRGFSERRIRPESVDSDRWFGVRCTAVTPGYFERMRIPILRGRDFTDRDRRNPDAMVIVNESLARRLYPDDSPLGKTIRVEDPRPFDYSEPGSERFEIIGVVKDAKYFTPWEAPTPFIYFPYWHMLFSHMDLHVSLRGGSYQAVTGSIRNVLESMDPELEVTSRGAISNQVNAFLYQEHSAASVLGVFGILALALASIGLYGILSFSVTQRTREFGIRAALGARNRDIVRQVTLEGIALAAAGLAAGLAASMALSRFIASRLHGLSPLDPWTYAAISLLAVFVAFLASFLPARHAAGNPMDALRSE